MKFFEDPMIKFPDRPQLLKCVQFFYEDGVIVYGGARGNFKLSGLKAIETVREVEKLLRTNNKTVEELIEQDCINIDKDNFLKTVSMLFQKGCIKNSQDNNKELTLLNAISSNYATADEIESLIKSTKVGVICEDKSYFDRLIQQNDDVVLEFEDLDSCDWLIYLKDDNLLKNSNLTKYLDENKKIIIFSNINNNYIVSPIISNKTIDLKLYNDWFIKEVMELKGNSLIKIDQALNIMLDLCKKCIYKYGVQTLSTTSVVIDGEAIRYLSVEDNSSLSVLDEFLKNTDFPATEFINKSSHLTHYQAKNLKLASKSLTSNLWKKVECNSNSMSKYFEYILGFNNERLGKKYTPTGGSINSNLIFCCNNDEDDLNGEGIYFYDNISNSYYQLSDTSPYKDTKYRSVIMIGNDCEVIGNKYGDFGFKVANLNIGTALLTSAYIMKEMGIKYEFISDFDERKILETVGSDIGKDIMNICIGVI